MNLAAAGRGRGHDATSGREERTETRLGDLDFDPGEEMEALRGEPGVRDELESRGRRASGGRRCGRQAPGALIPNIRIREGAETLR